MQQFKPITALKSFRRLLNDPTATDEVFEILRSVDPRGIDRLQALFHASAEGRHLLETRPNLLATLADRQALARLPEGSLGRTYLAFCEREGITADGLVEASERGRRTDLDPEQLWVAERMRDSHDLWHVVTGCRTDLAGELSVLSFTTAQTRSVGTAFLVLGGYARTFTLPGEFGPRGRKLVRQMFSRGRRARSLVVAPWEALLPLGIEEVRSRLGIDALPSYVPFYQSDIDLHRARAM